jgi:hypothetical protein
VISASTTLGELIGMARRLEPEHGPLQGIIIHGNGRGQAFYQFRGFTFEVEGIPPSGVEPANIILQAGS